MSGYVCDPRLDAQTVLVFVAADYFKLYYTGACVLSDIAPVGARQFYGIYRIGDDGVSDIEVVFGQGAGHQIAFGARDRLPRSQHGLFDGIYAQMHGAYLAG